jgi:hypothetical protein
VLLGLASVRGLTEKTREAHRWVWVYGGSPCTAVTPTCTVLKDGFERDTIGQLSHPHPQNSRFTPRCPSVVLWTLCSGVEWGVFDHQGLEKRNDAQAACEPGGGGCGGVPDHHPRLHTHRTSPAQALLTILMRHAATSHLLSHCHRRVWCPMCTSGSLRAERGWVTAVNGAPQWSWIWAATTVSLEERHGQAAV